MDALLRLHQDHYAEVSNRLDSMDTCLNNIETRLAITDLDDIDPNDN